MNSPFLKTKEIEINGELVKISQLSGLDRFDYLDFISELKEPDAPSVAPEPTADLMTKNDYLKAIKKVERAWGKFGFQCHCRLIAHSFEHGKQHHGKGIDEIYQYCLQNFTIDYAQRLHDEISELSGMKMQVVSESGKTEKQEKPDPKN